MRVPVDAATGKVTDLLERSGYYRAGFWRDRRNLPPASNPFSGDIHSNEAAIRECIAVAVVGIPPAKGGNFGDKKMSNHWALPNFRANAVTITLAEWSCGAFYWHRKS
jgi:hypothetical protein